jgi:hypothetical protein
VRYRLLALTMLTLLGLAVACGDGARTPVAPNAVAAGGGAVAAGDPTLKATVPAPQSPSGQLETRTPTLVSAPSTGKFVSANFSYRFEVQDASGATFDGALVNGTSWTVSQLDIAKTYRWRVRAEYEGRYTEWSSFMTVISPNEPEGYIKADELFDPLTNGRTVGQVYGPVEWIPNVGVKLLDSTSHITYELPQTLTEGEFSIMVTGIDEGSPGDKSKVMSMQEGGGDITANDYRFTAEKRGSDYPSPGAVTFRIITGDAGSEEFIHDSPRSVVDFSDESWYFWRFTWQTGLASLDVKEGSRTGPVIWGATIGTGSHPYRPTPHVVHLGAPVGRAGPQDATVPGLTVKNVWVSVRPRPVDIDK